MRLHEQRDLLVQNQEEALQRIVEFRMHLLSPKFTANAGEDYISTKEVDQMLLDLRDILWR